VFGFADPPTTFAVPSPKFQENVYGGVSPEAVAVKLTAVLTVPVVGAVVKDNTSAVPVIVIDEDADASLLVASVTFTLTVKDPFTVYVWDCELGLVVPPETFAVPSPKFQENVNGPVPPEAEAVKLTGVPTLPVVGAVVNVTTSCEIVMVDDALASLPLVSVAFTLTVKVPPAV